MDIHIHNKDITFDYHAVIDDNTSQVELCHIIQSAIEENSVSLKRTGDGMFNDKIYVDIDGKTHELYYKDDSFNIFDSLYGENADESPADNTERTETTTPTETTDAPADPEKDPKTRKSVISNLIDRLKRKSNENNGTEEEMPEENDPDSTKSNDEKPEKKFPFSGIAGWIKDKHKDPDVETPEEDDEDEDEEEETPTDDHGETEEQPERIVANKRGFKMIVDGFEMPLLLPDEIIQITDNREYINKLIEHFSTYCKMCYENNEYFTGKQFELEIIINEIKYAKATFQNGKLNSNIANYIPTNNTPIDSADYTM